MSSSTTELPEDVVGRAPVDESMPAVVEGSVAASCEAVEDQPSVMDGEKLAVDEQDDLTAARTPGSCGLSIGSVEGTSECASGTATPMAGLPSALPPPRPRTSTSEENSALLLQLEHLNQQLEKDAAKARRTSRAGRERHSSSHQPSFDQDDALPVVVTQSEADTVKWNDWAEIMADLDHVVKWRWRQLAAMIRAGVPGPLRGMIWQHASKAADSPHRSKYVKLLDEKCSADVHIRRDITRTFPLHNFFANREGVGQEALFNVLRAYALLDDEVGYCQGMPYIVGVLLMQMPEEEAFCVFINLMHDYHMRNLFKPGMAGLEACLFQLDRLLQELLPNLWNHFSINGIKSSMFASQWLLVLYASSLPLPAVFRIFDNFFVDGSETLFAVALAILKQAEHELMNMGFDEILLYFKSGLTARYTEPEQVASLLNVAQSFKVSRRKLEKLEREHAAMKAKGEEDQFEITRLQQENRSIGLRLQEQQRELQAALEKCARLQSSEKQKIEEVERLSLALKDKSATLEVLEMMISNMQAAQKSHAAEHQTLVAELAATKVRVAELEYVKAHLGSKTRRNEDDSHDSLHESDLPSPQSDNISFHLQPAHWLEGLHHVFKRSGSTADKAKLDHAHPK